MNVQTRFSLTPTSHQAEVLAVLQAILPSDRLWTHKDAISYMEKMRRKTFNRLQLLIDKKPGLDLVVTYLTVISFMAGFAIFGFTLFLGLPFLWLVVSGVMFVAGYLLLDLRLGKVWKGFPLDRYEAQGGYLPQEAKAYIRNIRQQLPMARFEISILGNDPVVWFVSDRVLCSLEEPERAVLDTFTVPVVVWEGSTVLSPPS